MFISYSHDSETHRERVLGLSERLRQDGIETILDQCVNGTPPEGWPCWMLNRLDEADRVLLACTPVYYRRFRGHEKPSKDKGVDWEGAIVTQEIYDARSATTRFIPVFFAPADESLIPEPVRGQTRYCLTSEAAYRDLYDDLLDQAGIEPGPLGELKRKPCLQVGPLTFANPDQSPTRSADRGQAPGCRPQPPSSRQELPRPSATEGNLRPPATPTAQRPRVDLAHLPAGAEHFLGRGPELAALDAAWTACSGIAIVEVIAFGGTGKTARIKRWLDAQRAAEWGRAAQVFGWSFYSQGTGDDRQASEDLFLATAIDRFGIEIAPSANPADKGQDLADWLGAQRTLLILDSCEPLQYPPGPLAGELRAPGLKALLTQLAVAERAAAWPGPGCAGIEHNPRLVAASDAVARRAERMLEWAINNQAAFGRALDARRNPTSLWSPLSRVLPHLRRASALTLPDQALAPPGDRGQPGPPRRKACAWVAISSTIPWWMRVGVAHMA